MESQQATAREGSGADRAGGAIRLRWLGTAGFQLAYRGEELLLDPFISRPAGASPTIRLTPAEFSSVSLILVSHGHFDHAQDVAAIARACPARVCAPLRTCQMFARRGVDRGRLLANEQNPEVSWSGARVQIIPSRHICFDPALVLRTLVLVLRGGVFGPLLRRVWSYPCGSNSEFLLELDGYRLLFSGSGGGDWRALARLAPDCFLLPFAGRSDVVAYYLAALAILRPRAVVLHHFDRFFPSFVVDYPVEAFRERLARELPAIRCVVPRPLEWFSLP